MFVRSSQVSCLVYPESRGKFSWDIFVSLLLVVSCFVTPLELCYKYNHPAYYTCSYLIDILFFVDMVVIFNTAFTTEDFETVEDRKAIACQYIYGWFWIDLFAILPFQAFIPTQ